MADHLLNRILAWAAGRSSAVRFTCSAMLSQDRILRRHLDTIRLKYSDENAAGAETGNFDASGERGAFTDRDHHIAVARADAPTLEQLAANRETIRRWCEKGNYLMLVNLDRQGLRDFNRLVGFEHELRPFRVERVRLTPASAAEPLMLGIPNSAFSQLATDMIAPWIKKYSYSGRVFTHVVDYEEVGAFGTSGESKLFDGLINSDFWHYVQYIVFEPAKDPGRFASGKIDLDVPLRKRERIRQVNIRLSKTYYIPKDIRIVFDGNENDAVDRVLEDTESEQELAFEPRDCENIRIELLSYYHEHESKKNTLTIDELRILRDLPKDVAKRVVPLTSPAGLVKYPIGKGAILLNQLDYTEEKPDAASKSEARALVNIEQNRVKKAFIMSSLLRNMGADFLETPL
jgi:beta-galactosidase